VIIASRSRLFVRQIETCTTEMDAATSVLSYSKANDPIVENCSIRISSFTRVQPRAISLFSAQATMIVAVVHVPADAIDPLAINVVRAFSAT